MTAILAIDTCGGSGYVGVLEADSAATLAEEALPERGTQEMLLPAITRVLAAANRGCSDLAAIAVVAGPGSFTGVRIGLAAAKGLAEALGIPLIALSRLGVLPSVLPSPVSGVVYAWLDAGRGDVYVGSTALDGVTESANAAWMESRADALQRLNPGDVVAVLEPALLENVPGAVLVSGQQYRQSLMRMSKNAFRSRGFADTALLDAEYLRIPDAEIALRAKVAAEQSSQR